MNHGSRPPCQGILYTVKPGDTLSKIARRYNLTVRDIVSANPQISDPDKITVGQVICIPKVASQLRECAIVLALSREATVALPEIAGGVVLVQRAGEGKYALTFAATGLPNPGSLGEFDTYLGSININGQEYSAVLRVSAPFEQEPTWAGTRVININPFNYPDSTVTIFPFNLETSIRSGPILGGTIAECKR
ncbi:LysM peptidoglycan-binding domain-containing protein [Halothermothrix orenii]|uniref:Peptidoglycan-binding LysM n=1 Tax=Halothermothrix orenii (strain H 168 / OCM 544 / DSM 9562) TaxID=373903 RepID=B8D158_HALOH|nr:LysM peptidoglycan-binding domain-containing protein [Halothermothrix orenii]ACL69027.1 Peptidoglycan-binding LysM [Halothermothrix orenii H 168]